MESEEDNLEYIQAQPAEEETLELLARRVQNFEVLENCQDNSICSSLRYNNREASH